MKILQFLMFTVNVIFWAIGGTLLGVGIWLAVDPEAFDALNIAGSAGMDDALWSAAVYTMIGVGAGVFLVGFLGCFGAIRADSSKKNILLKLYFVLVKLIVIAEIVTIILTAIFWGSINDEVKVAMTKDVQQNYINETDDDGITTSWNKMQMKWKCCGSENYYDYQGSKYRDISKPNMVPWTCCVLYKGTDGSKVSDVVNRTQCNLEGALPYDAKKSYSYLYPTGCYYGLVDFIDQNAAIIIGVTCGFIGLQIVGLVFACCLMKN